MSVYKSFFRKDETEIAIEHWSGSISVEMHMHQYYELVFIEKGSCTHFYKDQQTMLIPGDCFLIPPHHLHGFDIQIPSYIYNCQFHREVLTDDTLQIANEMCFSKINENAKDSNIGFRANINRHGIIHLAPNDRMFVLSNLGYMMTEQNTQGDYFRLLTANYLQTILILLKRIADLQYKNYAHQPMNNKKMITDVLTHIDENLSEELSFTNLASQYSVSPNHFRKLFKDVTGLSPIDYVNRLRVLKARDQLINGHGSISDIAASVGIYDANYFSRLFKQYMGCSPRHYIP